MDGNMFVVDNEPDPVEEARAAGTAIARARHEVRRRVGEFLDNAVDDEELIQRLAYPDVDEVIEEATERHLGSVTDGKAKLARSLVREVHAKRAEKETVHLDSGDVEIEKGKLTKMVGGPPSEHMDKVRALADKGNKAALFFLNVLHKGARDQITCPNCRGQGCTECEQTGQIDDDKRPGGTSDR